MPPPPLAGARPCPRRRPAWVYQRQPLQRHLTHPAGAPSLTTRPSPLPRRCHLAEVCKAFKALVDAQAFRDAPLVLKMSEIAGCLEAPRQRERLDLRCSLMRALGRIAPSVTRIRVLCDLYGGEGVDVEAVLCMAGGAAREVEVALGSYRGVQGLLQELEDKFAYPELQKIALHDCSFWADWDVSGALPVFFVLGLLLLAPAGCLEAARSTLPGCLSPAPLCAASLRPRTVQVPAQGGFHGSTPGAGSGGDAPRRWRAAAAPHRAALAGAR